MSRLVLKYLAFLFTLEYMNSNVFGQTILNEHGHPRVVAALKGTHPPCNLKPGETFCETLANYPYELVLNAVKHSNFDIKKFLVDESRDDGPIFYFDNTQHRQYPRQGRTVGGPQNQPPPLWEKSTVMQPPLPSLEDAENILEDEGEEEELLEPEHFIELTYGENQNGYRRMKRNTTFTEKIESNPPSKNNITVSERNVFRKKRQDPGSLEPGAPLCSYTSRYIFPQTAMCASTGEWMYVVNINTAFDRLSQMIKTEICNTGIDGQPCMGDCGGSDISFGIVSRCEQHYNQKRLLTLSATGTHIITEMFWLPTCCICRTFRQRNLSFI